MNLFDLSVKIALEDEVSEKIPALGDKLRSGLALAGKAAAVGIGAAATAVGALTNAAVDGYAEYEQLTGGVETLFGTSAGAVMRYAKNAYQTAGLSANEYMTTVTGFSASLLQSLGGDTQAAAELADQAITDMADNANKMGTDLTAIQNAYQGFAKQNFTMLDNLKLGYGGTQQEMQRLLEDAEAISGIQYDISSYADIVEAIHVVQTEMGITGTTAAEASSTIAGSAASMKAAWQNLVAGLADENANVDVLLDNFLDSVETTAGNVLPVVERVLTNIFGALQENGPEMVASGARLLGKLAAGALQAIPTIIASIPDIVAAIVSGFEESGPDIKNIGKDVVRGIWSGIQSLASWLGGKVKGFFSGIVDGAKSVLGIHSPSTVFAGMGENMVLGLEKGWGENIAEAQRDISKDLNFGSASIDYNASAAGRIGRVLGGTGTESSMTIIVQSVLDGKVIGETAYRYNRDHERAYGVS